MAEVVEMDTEASAMPRLQHMRKAGEGGAGAWRAEAGAARGGRASLLLPPGQATASALWCINSLSGLTVLLLWGAS
jgi:hypothetical protein